MLLQNFKVFFFIMTGAYDKKGIYTIPLKYPYLKNDPFKLIITVYHHKWQYSNHGVYLDKGAFMKNTNI